MLPLPFCFLLQEQLGRHGRLSRFPPGAHRRGFTLRFARGGFRVPPTLILPRGSGCGFPRACPFLRILFAHDLLTLFWPTRAGPIALPLECLAGSLRRCRLGCRGSFRGFVFFAHLPFPFR